MNKIKQYLKNEPIYILWYGPIHNISHFWHTRIKKVSFRLKNGFWPSECWSLDYTIAKFVLPRLKYFRDNVHGYPSPTLQEEATIAFVSEGERDDYSIAAWKKRLDRMIWSFDWVARDAIDDDSKGWWSKRYHIDKQHRSRVDKRYKAGMKLFAEYFSALWD